MSQNTSSQNTSLNNSNDPIVIVSAVRTPMGGFQGDLSTVTATDLGAAVIRAAVERAGLKANDIDDVVMGNVLSAGLKQGPARQAALRANLPNSVACVTVNKLCGSGMKAVMLAHDGILAGSSQIAVAGGMENMSLAPYLLQKARAGFRMGHGEIKDHMFFDGLEDAETGRLMGSFAQDTANQQSISREDMDNFAIESLRRAKTAIQEGYFKDEIIPISVETRSGTVVVSVDEQPGKAKEEKIHSLKPAFAKDGTITAANASSISDGASALIIMRASEAERRGVKPLAKIIAHTSQSQHPSEFTCAPVGALRKLFEKTGWSVDSIDLFEINEAFAMVAMMPVREFNLDHSKVNIHGGACALGHPVGSTGSRLLVSLIYALRRLNKKRGVAALCIGGGEATAMAIEVM
ncbi:MAG: acetyl-CoA C-acyltransferase [Pseudomonadota bacterium]